MFVRVNFTCVDALKPYNYRSTQQIQLRCQTINKQCCYIIGCYQFFIHGNASSNPSHYVYQRCLFINKYWSYIIIGWWLWYNRITCSTTLVMEPLSHQQCWLIVWLNLEMCHYDKPSQRCVFPCDVPLGYRTPESVTKGSLLDEMLCWNSERLD